MPTGIDRQTAPARRAEQDNPNPISKRRTASRFGMSPADGSGARDVCATVDNISAPPHRFGCTDQTVIDLRERPQHITACPLDWNKMGLQDMLSQQAV